MLRRTFVPETEQVTGTGANWMMTSFIICTPHQIKKNDMGEIRGTSVRRKRCKQNFGRETERGH